MRFAATLLLFVFGLSAQEYPHAFPREGVTQLFDNERITVWQVYWKKGVQQPYHRHRYDMAGVYLTYGPICVTALDGTKRYPDKFEAPRPHFQRKGITHKEESIAGPNDSEELAIMIDLKDGPPPSPTLMFGIETSFPRVGATDVLDNERVRMWDYKWLPNRPVAQHVHDKDSVEIFFEGGVIKTTLADGREYTKTVAFKDARFVPRGQNDSEAAVSGTPRAIVVELK